MFDAESEALCQARRYERNAQRASICAGHYVRCYPCMEQCVRNKAGLPPDFRPRHGLRHTFASHLASSGKVDLYTLQKLLTHSSPQMTQRYAHLADEGMQRAASIANILADLNKPHD